MKLHSTLALLLNMMLLLPSVDANTTTMRTAAQIGGEPKYISEGQDLIRGFCPDLLQAINSLAPDLSFQGQDQWQTLSRIITDTANGKLDIACGLQDSPDRRRRLQVVEFPLWTVNYHLVVRTVDNIQPQNWREVMALAPDNIVLVNTSSSVVPKLQRMAIKVDDGAESSQQNLEKLLRSRARFYYVRLPGLAHELRYFPRELKVLPTAMGSETFYMMLSRQQPESVVVRLAEVLQQLEQNGQLEQLRQRWQQ